MRTGGAVGLDLDEIERKVVLVLVMVLELQLELDEWGREVVSELDECRQELGWVW